MTNGEYEWYVCIKPIHEFVKGKMYKLTVGHTPSGTIGFDPAFVNSYFRKATLEEICDVGSVWPKGYAAAFAKKVGGDIPEGQIETLRKWCQFILDVTKPEEKSPVLSNSSNTGKDKFDQASNLSVNRYQAEELTIQAIDKKRVCPKLKGDALHKFKNEFNTLKQLIYPYERYDTPLNYRVALYWASWGAQVLKGFDIKEEEKAKMGIPNSELSHQEVTKISDQVTEFEETFANLVGHYFICKSDPDTDFSDIDFAKEYSEDLLLIARKQFIEEACEYLYKYNRNMLSKHGAKSVLDRGDAIDVEDFRNELKKGE